MAATEVVLALGLLAILPRSVQGQDEVIMDPELMDSSSGSGTSDGDEVIVDPELGGASSRSGGGEDYGWGEVYQPPATSETLSVEDDYDPMANTGIAHLELQGQTMVDIHKEYNLEDFYEARLRAIGEIDFRLTRRTRLSIGSRFDWGWYAPNQDDPYLKRPVDPTDPNGPHYNENLFAQDRYEIDITPLSAYVDTTLADGVHLRVGYQVVNLGRMDGYSATDMLAVYDLRPAPKPSPSSIRLAQPAIRLDWDLGTWATLQAVYVPWFLPHVTRPGRDQYAGRVTTGEAAQSYGPMSNLLDPSYQTKAGETAFRFLGPAPDFTHPQAEARLNMRGHAFEVAALAGTALEKFPAVYYTPLVNAYQLNPTEDNLGPAASAFASGNRLFDVEYHRYYQFGLDGSFDIAPLQVGFELAYSPSRHLYAVTKDGLALPAPNVSQQIYDAETVDGVTTPSNVTDKSIRKGTQVIQATAHVEYLHGENLVLVAEGYLIQALKMPYDRSRDWLGFLPNSGTFLGGLLGATYTFGEEGRWVIDFTVAAAPGRSLIVTPSIEAKVAEGFYINVGAQIFEGKNPTLLPGRAAINIFPGGVANGYDNVYLGFRWLP